MVKKLINLQAGKIHPDNLDSLMVQEVLTSGNLYGLYFREKLEELFEFVRVKFTKDQSQEIKANIV